MSDTIPNNACSYIAELKSNINKPWFSKLCDLASNATNDILTEDEKIELQSIYFEEQTYSSPTSSSNSTDAEGIAVTLTSTTPSRFEYINSFKHFKQLSDKLKIQFKKQTTLIFGANGSGKSSICDTFKILGHATNPLKPLFNVNHIKIPANNPSFKYKLDGQSENEWTYRNGYGALNGKIKIFDSHIALNYVQNTIAPTEIIELTPFGLHVFVYIEKFMTQHKESLDNNLRSKQNTIQISTEKALRLFQNNKSENKEKFTDNTTITDLDMFKKCITTFKETDTDNLIIEKKKELKDFESGLKPEGKLLLRSEIDSITQWVAEIKRVLAAFKPLDIESLKTQIETLRSKQNTQQELTESIALEDIDFKDFKQFLITTQKVFDFENTDDSSCPFCRKTIQREDVTTKELIKNYKGFLNSSLEQEIQTLSRKLTTLLDAFADFKIMDTTRLLVSEIEVIPEETCSSIKAFVESIQNKIPQKNNPTEFELLSPADFDVRVHLKINWFSLI